MLRLVAQGMSNREIADVLSLSEHTVKSHLANILAKLHLRSRAHAAAYAVQAGLVRDIADRPIGLLAFQATLHERPPV